MPTTIQLATHRESIHPPPLTTRHSPTTDTEGRVEEGEGGDAAHGKALRRQVR